MGETPRASLCLTEFGALPGPGVDIVIHPSNPISSTWELEPKTVAGQNFLELKYPARKIHGARWLAKLKNTLESFGMKHETDWSNVVDIKVDP